MPVYAAGRATLERSFAVSRPDDPHEQQAARIADVVARAWECSKVPAQFTGKELTRTNANGATARPLPVAASHAIDAALNSPGRPLDATARAFMEPHFGVNFGSVRVHTGAKAAAAARSVNALAFTVGHDIVFGPGLDARKTTAGRSLLAHELAHVAQSLGRSLDCVFDGGGSALSGDALHDRSVRVSAETRAGEPWGRPTRYIPLHRAVAVHEDRVISMPMTQKERIARRLHELILQSEDQPDEEMGKRVARYLVEVERLDNRTITTLFGDFQKEQPDLLKAAMFAGSTFHALRELGMVDLASSVVWYVGTTIRDTLAGDFVEDPTALAIVFRTLLTLIPYVDQAADIEDISANIIRALLDPKGKLTSPGWWFTMVCALVGMFPELGSAAVGIVKLGKKGVGHLAKPFLASIPDVSSIVNAMGRLKGSADDLMEMGRLGVTELLAKADAWRPVVIKQFHDLINTLIDNLAALPAALGGKVAGVLDSLRMMKREADAMIEAAIDDLLSALTSLLDDLGLAPPRLALSGGPGHGFFMEGQGTSRGRAGGRSVVFGLHEVGEVFSRVGDNAEQIEDLIDPVNDAIRRAAQSGARGLDDRTRAHIRRLVADLKPDTFAGNPLLQELYSAAERNVRQRAQLTRFNQASANIGQQQARVRELEDQLVGANAQARDLIEEEITDILSEIDVNRQVLQGQIGARGAYELIRDEMQRIARAEGIDWPYDVVIHHLIPVHEAPELATHPANLLLVRGGAEGSHDLIHQLLQGVDTNRWAGFSPDVLAEIQDALGL
jgi:hypothetical protein